MNCIISKNDTGSTLSQSCESTRLFGFTTPNGSLNGDDFGLEPDEHNDSLEHDSLEEVVINPLQQSARKKQQKNPLLPYLALLGKSLSSAISLNSVRHCQISLSNLYC